MKYIDADLLRKEIEKRLKNIRDYMTGVGMKYHGPKYSKAQGKESAYDALLNILDSLQQEQQEEPDKSLEEAAENIYKVPFGTRAEDFIAGAEWQARQLLQGSPMPEDTVLFNKGVAEGRRLERDDMLKDAVEGEVIKTDKHTSVRYKSFYGTDRYFYGIADKQFKPSDKVRIVVLKEEE